MTSRLVDYICRRALNRTFSDVAREVGVSEGSVRALFGVYAEKNTPQAGSDLRAPKALGVDDKYIIVKPVRKSSNVKNPYRAWATVLTNLEDNKVIEVIAERSELALERVRSQFTNLDEMKVVCHDMNRLYYDFSQRCGALSIVDKFHVMMTLNAAVNDARQEVRRQIKSSDPNAAKLLRNRGKLFLKMGPHKNERGNIQRDYLLKKYPLLDKVYKLKEEFSFFYRQHTREEAAKFFDVWKGRIDQEAMPYFEDILSAMEDKTGSWRSSILNWFDFSKENYTNGFTESFNRTINEVVRSGKGYSFPVLRQKLLMTHAFDMAKPGKFHRNGRVREANKPREKIAGKEEEDRRHMSNSELMKCPKPSKHSHCSPRPSPRPVQLNLTLIEKPREKRKKPGVR